VITHVSAFNVNLANQCGGALRTNDRLRIH
jgi:hypothetical protein